MADEDISSGDAEASYTQPVQCSALRKDDYVILKGRPCRIVETSAFKTDKYGLAKVHLVGIDIFTQKKYEDVCPATHNMDIPDVKERNYEVIKIMDGLALLTGNGGVKEDIKLPEGDLGEEIRERFDKAEEFMVTVMSAHDEEHIVAIKLKNSA